MGARNMLRVGRKASLEVLQKHRKSEILLFSVSGFHSSIIPPLKSCWTVFFSESEFLL